MTAIDSYSLDKILELLKNQSGIDFGGYRRSMLTRRIISRIEALNLNNPKAYLDLITHNPTEINQTIDAIAINVSCFFRNPLVFEILANSIIPQIIDAKQNSKNHEIRIWSAGCAAGEEAYSIAILLKRAIKNLQDIANWQINIFGTDIDANALSAAKDGVFAKQSLLDVKLGVFEEYFEEEAGKFKLTSEIRNMVSFSIDNLISPQTIAPPDSIFGCFDIVLCRNLLIYFTQELQDSVLKKLCSSISDSGYLILGEAESLNLKQNPDLYAADTKNKIYQKNKATAINRI